MKLKKFSGLLSSGFLQPSKKALFLSSLYLTQAIPKGYLKFLPILLSEKGTSLRLISLIAFLSWGDWLKPFFGSIFDSKQFSSVRQRKSVLVAVQSLIIALFISSLFIPSENIPLLAALFSFCSFLTSIHDTAVDGLAVNFLTKTSERSLGGFGQYFGYKMGILLTNGIFPALTGSNIKVMCITSIATMSIVLLFTSTFNIQQERTQSDFSALSFNKNNYNPKLKVHSNDQHSHMFPAFRKLIFSPISLMNFVSVFLFRNTHVDFPTGFSGSNTDSHTVFSYSVDPADETDSSAREKYNAVVDNLKVDKDMRNERFLTIFKKLLLSRVSIISFTSLFLYKFADHGLDFIWGPLLVQAKIDRSTIVKTQFIVGTLASIFGSFFGSILSPMIGSSTTALSVLSLARLFPNILLLLFSHYSELRNPSYIAFHSFLENVIGSAITGAMLNFLLERSDQEYPATSYAIMNSINLVGMSLGEFFFAQFAHYRGFYQSCFVGMLINVLFSIVILYS
jgi:hypothetical protein